MIPDVESDALVGMKLPPGLVEYLLTPSVILKNGETITPKKFIDDLLADGYGNPMYFTAPKGSQAGYLSKKGGPKATLNYKQMFYADAAFMNARRHNPPTK